ncbi:MAG: NAD(P)-dependent alcohol dehydrogenase [Chloroflexota bacterium]|nr:NAD(P)-dependent alcohol dehydrogenase [Chloroflexota bacterium]
MKAITQQRYGSPDVLRMEDVERPAVEDDRVLVRVRASSVNATDWRHVRGRPYAARPMMGGIRRPKGRATGVDAAGIVEATGKDVTHVAPGDEVYGSRSGAYAEYVSGRTFVHKPVNLSFEQAAAVPVAGCTALQALRDKGGIQAGQHVLINGAGGGVGTFAVQLAKAFGAEVTAVSNTANLELMRSLGADHVIDYTRQDFTKGGSRYDIIAEVGGRPSLRACRRALAPGGTLVIVGAGKGDWVGPLARFAAGALRSRLLKQRIVGFVAEVTKEDLLTLKGLIEAGKVSPVMDRTYPLSETAEGLRYVEEGHARGKVVITVP